MVIVALQYGYYHSVICNRYSSNDVIRKYINETFHVENDFLFQLNPCEYDTVPHFVIFECNREILGTDEIETEE